MPPGTSAPIMPTATSSTPVPSSSTSLQPRPAIPTTANGRQDLLALKQQLADALGDDGPQYWEALRDFVTGKLNRTEFDFYANLYLSRQNAPLHNAFILATIHNAQKDSGPPANQRSIGWSKRKRVDAGENEHDPKRKKIKRTIMSLGRQERERLKSLKEGKKNKGPSGQPMPPRISKRPTIPVSEDLLPASFRHDLKRGLFAPLCQDSKELPSFESLRDRMTMIALEQGVLGGVAGESVEALLYALESHLKTIIAQNISKIRSNRAFGIRTGKADVIPSHAPASLLTTAPTQPPPVSLLSTVLPAAPAATSITEADFAQPSPEKTSITARDLAFSFEYNPYVLVENPINVERLTSLLIENEDVEEVSEDEQEDDDGAGFFM